MRFYLLYDFIELKYLQFYQNLNKVLCIGTISKILYRLKKHAKNHNNRNQ